MPRPKKDGAPEPKRRSRNGCWPCKARKVKCGEEKPACINCKRQGEACDYSIRLNWGGRVRKKSMDADADADADAGLSPGSPANSPHTSTFSVSTGPHTGQIPQFAHSQYSFVPRPHHSRSRSDTSSMTTLNTSVADSGLATHTSPTLIHSAISPRNARNGYFQFSPVLPPQDSLQIQMNKTLQAVTSAPLDPRLQSAVYSDDASDDMSPCLSAVGTNGHHRSSSSVSTKRSAVDSPYLSMPPPLVPISASTDASITLQDPFETSTHRTKRQRLSPVEDILSPSMAPYRNEMYTERMPEKSTGGSFTHYGFNTPLTPGSSITLDETPQLPKLAHPHSESDLRRFSVNSLLSKSATADPPGSTRHHYPMYNAREGYTTYGYDVGEPDEDTPRNRDAEAIRQFSPPTTYHGLSGYDSPGLDPRINEHAFEKGGYYAKPVPIRISKDLEPLPAKLLDHPMNLLYFHHFINHTARILVPHDCEDNPFRNVLPKLAVRDDHILDLLLAFSASHRARLLGHREPANRIAHWVQDVFPQLRRSIDHTNSTPNSTVSDSSLTTAIMLVSLEIISPNAFDVPIPWQNHLKLARQMILARGGLQSIQRRDKNAYFLSRWFAYLDVLGSLSGSQNDRPLGDTYWVDDGIEDRDAEWRIDCFFGFTARCVAHLARIAELAKKCESERFDAAGEVRPSWTPSPPIAAAGEKLLRDLFAGKDHVYLGCAHRPAMPLPHSTTSTSFSADGNDNDDDDPHHEAGWDHLEIFKTNIMFHCAGIIHLLRRVLGRPRDHPQVQAAVCTIIDELSRVRKGGTAEACVLFPLFTAGCEAIEDAHRECILDRIQSSEGFGMIQVNKARALLQKVWKTGKAWEMHVEGEFFG